MKHILAILALLFAFTAHAQTAKKIPHRAQDQDHSICVNDGGTKKCLTIDGPTANTSLPAGLDLGQGAVDALDASIFTASGSITSGSCDSFSGRQSHYIRVGSVVYTQIIISVNITSANSNCNFRIDAPTIAGTFSSDKDGSLSVMVDGDTAETDLCTTESGTQNFLCVGNQKNTTGSRSFRLIGSYEF